MRIKQASSLIYDIKTDKMNTTVIENLRKALEEGHWRSFEKYFERVWNFEFKLEKYPSGQYLFEIKQKKYGGRGPAKKYIRSVIIPQEEEINIEKKKVYNELLHILEIDKMERRYGIKKPVKISIYDIAKTFGVSPDDIRYIKVVYDNKKETTKDTKKNSRGGSN